jgi:hypothetical protein
VLDAFPESRLGAHAIVVSARIGVVARACRQHIGRRKKIVECITTRAAGCALLLAATAGPALAQDGNWTFDLSAYVWFNDTTVTSDTPLGEVESTLSFSDAIKDLEFAFMGTAEARNGPWSVIGDLLYFKLADTTSTPAGVVFSEVEAESKITVRQQLSHLPGVRRRQPRRRSRGWLPRFLDKRRHHLHRRRRADRVVQFRTRTSSIRSSRRASGCPSMTTGSARSWSTRRA